MQLYTSPAFGHSLKWKYIKQEGLAVASIARDDPSPLPGMHRDHNAPACTAIRIACGRIVACNHNMR